MFNKLTSLVERYESLKLELMQPDITSNQTRYRECSKEFSELEPIVQSFLSYQNMQKQHEEASHLLNEDDVELRQLAKAELHELEEAIAKQESDLLTALLPSDPNDHNNVFLEIRAGAGGDEASIFSGDLCRMYMRYAESKRWKTEILSESDGEHGGYKEVILRITGKEVYATLKFESGVHRVQRVPETEAQGRVHTSTCTVAVLPELEEIDDIEINPSDLRIDTFRASGAGGQHVQKTDSAIRITHIPTGTVVECQDERSQHKNRARAMSLLKSKILQAERNKQQTEQARTRRNLVGTGDRSERIRTYNYPQGRLTDHRINLTLYQLQRILEGELDEVIQALQQEHRADLIAGLGDQFT